MTPSALAGSRRAWPAVAALLALAAAPAAATTTLVDVSGSVDSGVTIDAGEAAAISFTLDLDATDVAIGIEISCIACAGGYWLNSSAIGPSSSFADTLAGEAFGGSTTTMPLFSGLALSAGDYFVVIHVDSGFAIWSGTASPTVAEHPDASRGLDFFAETADAWAPMSDFSVTFGKGLHYDVTGMFVPEPGTAALLGLALLGLGVRPRRGARRCAAVAKPSDERRAVGERSPRA